MVFIHILLTVLVAKVTDARDYNDPITFSCDKVLCPEGMECIYGPKGPTCTKPGHCPGYRLDIVGVCKGKCKNDEDCGGSEKCCFNGCVYRCFPPVLPSIVKCDAMTCERGYTCRDYPTGGECEPIVRPGTCPPLACKRPAKTCTGGKDKCEVDADCRKSSNHKCCQNCEGCKECVERTAPNSCKNMFCAQKTACMEDPYGAKCVKDEPKEGHCPLTTCSQDPNTLGMVCNDPYACISDVQCSGKKKCCKGCDNCGSCVDPPVPPSCKDIECRKDEVCVMEWVKCSTPPCPLRPKCDKPCLLPKAEGMCVDTIKSFYYEPSLRKCSLFVYGGCEGNNNRFKTKEDCENACEKNVRCSRRSPESPCVEMNECSTNPTANRPLCPEGKICCETKCGTRCYRPQY